jgi:putative ABC transport system permease protein
MNLALLEMRRHIGRFIGTSVGVALLFTVVLAMAGIYGGLVDDATVLVRSLRADLWVVQKATHGPFADISRLDPTIEQRVAGIAGVRVARSFTFQVIERPHESRSLRFALVGLSWTEDRGRKLPIVAGRALAQAHGELIADTSLGLTIGAVVHLATEDFTVVGLTRQVLASSGDPVVFATIADAQLITEDVPTDVVRTERERRVERLLLTDVGRSQPALEDLARDPRWKPPALAAPPLSAILVDVADPSRLSAVRDGISRWPDVAVYSSSEQERFLLDSVVEKPRRQLALFSIILVVTSSVLISALLYMMTLSKSHDIAVLKLIGAPITRIAGMVLQQAWLIGAVGYAIAVAVGSQAFPHFPRRVVLTPWTIGGVGLLVFLVSTLASILGVMHVLKIDPGQALET